MASMHTDYGSARPRRAVSWGRPGGAPGRPPSLDYAGVRAALTAEWRAPAPAGGAAHGGAAVDRSGGLQAVVGGWPAADRIRFPDDRRPVVRRTRFVGHRRPVDGPVRRSHPDQAARLPDVHRGRACAATAVAVGTPTGLRAVDLRCDGRVAIAVGEPPSAARRIRHAVVQPDDDEHRSVGTCRSRASTRR